MKHTSLIPFLWSFIKPYRHYCCGLLLVGLYWSVHTTAAPYLLKLIIDSMSTYQGDLIHIFDTIQIPAIIYMILFCLSAANFRFRDWVNLKLHPNLRRDVIEKMFSYLTGHSYRFFQNNFAGSLGNKIMDMSGSIVSIISQLEEVIAGILAILIAVVIMLFVHPVFGCILASWTIVFLILSFSFTKKTIHLSKVFSESKSMLLGKVIDNVTNIVNIGLFARSPYEQQTTHHAVSDTVTKDRVMQRYILRLRIFQDISIIILITAMLSTLIHLYSRGRVTIGDFAFILTVSISIFQHLWYMASQFVTFFEAVGKCAQAMTIMEEPHEIIEQPHAKALHLTKGEIIFNDVTFHYARNNNIFENQSVTLEAGKKVGLVGYSGSGKTSFVHLILRFFDVESGKITIDGTDIRDITLDSLRQHISMIPQDTTLFHRSLKENIRYGNIQATDKEVFAAATSAHCHEFISTLEDGYDTLVGERGIKLSGGQRQRIAIARAILKNAPILILDEATSALDSVTEQYIQESLNQLMQNRTTIVIAHRLSTLANMDRILVFDQGHIIEEGTHKNLLKQKGHYANLWKMQAGGFLPEKAA